MPILPTFQVQLRALLHSLPASSRLLALGEPTHGPQAFPRWRNRLFRLLVKEYGFRSIAVESDILAGRQVNNYVAGGLDRSTSVTLGEVMSAGFSHGFGAYSANRELVTWLRVWNTQHGGADQVHFYGFDAPMENYWAASPRSSLLALHAFLSCHLQTVEVDVAALQALCGEDAHWTNEAAALDPAQSVGLTPEARELRVLADDLQTLLRRETPRLQGLPDFWEAQLHARTALGLLRYHANMAAPGPERLAKMLALRDLMMADNLSAIAGREEKRGGTLIFAHNLHLQRSPSGMNIGARRAEWWSAGAQLGAQLGERYAFIATGLGAAPALGIGKPAPDTIEGQLMTLSEEVSLLSATVLSEVLTHPLTRRSDFPPQAFSLSPALLAGASGLLFIKNVAQDM